MSIRCSCFLLSVMEYHVLSSWMPPQPCLHLSMGNCEFSTGKPCFAAGVLFDSFFTSDILHSVSYTDKQCCLTFTVCLSHFTELGRGIMSLFFWPASKPGQPENLRIGLLCASSSKLSKNTNHSCTFCWRKAGVSSCSSWLNLPFKQHVPIVNMLNK